MFNADFFPVNRAIGRRMYKKIQNKNAYYFLEPSAGKGDLADVIRQPTTIEELEAEDEALKLGALTEEEQGERRWRRERLYRYNEDNSRVHVDVIEQHPGLISVLRGKGYDVVGFDFLSYEGISYYDAILMNPPFSNGAAHLLKAWDFLYAGEIVCLLNEETIKNPYTEERKRLAGIIEATGNVEYWGDCFSEAERKTGVKVACVYLKKNAPDDSADMWAKAATQEPRHEGDFDGDNAFLAVRDNLGNMEHYYNCAITEWIKGIEHIRRSSLYMHELKVSDHRRGNEKDFEGILAGALSNTHSCRAEFIRRIRRLAWTSVFEQMEFRKWLDSAQQDKFIRDVERDSTIPFTADNIKGTLENVFLSRRKMFDESVSNVFDELCSHAVQNGCGPVAPSTVTSHRRQSEGWKTNDSYKVNEKLIFPWGCSYDHDFGAFRENYGGTSGRLYQDLDRILCVLDGKPFDKCYTIGEALSRQFQSIGRLKGVGAFDSTCESEYFDIRFFKKGTVHLKWKRPDLLEAFNKHAAQGKKWIGENTQQYRKYERPRKEWACTKDGCNFEDGTCSHCGALEVEPFAHVECPLCRAIAEETGVIECPIHEIHGPAFCDVQQLQIEAPEPEPEPEPEETAPIALIAAGANPTTQYGLFG